MLPPVSSLPAWLVPSVYLNWSEDWLREAVAVATGSNDHFLPRGADGPQRGDVVVTVVGSDPGVVVDVELMGSTQGEDWIADDAFGPDKPVLWDDLFNGASAYSRSSGWLPQEHARLVLDGIAHQFRNGAVGTLEPGDCETGQLSPNLHVLRILGHRTLTGREMNREERCYSCEQFVDVTALRPHDDGARAAAESGTSRDLARMIADTYLVCDPCHELLHPHAISAQRARMRPACPSCHVRGTAKRIVWNETIHDEMQLEPGVVYGGFDVPVPTPEWYCPQCHANFAAGVVGTRALDGGSSVVPPPPIDLDVAPPVESSVPEI